MKPCGKNHNRRKADAAYGRIFVLLSVCAVFPALLAANPTPDAESDTRRREIEAMSASHRRNLERQYRTYQECSDEQRKAYSKIDQAIKDDPALKSTLDAYHEWLKTLSVYERDELRKETDPKARMRLVREFRQRQFVARGLNSDDFAAVMKVIERRLPISAEDRKSLESLSGIRRHGAIIQRAFKAARDKFSPGSGPPWPRWPRDELMHEMIGVISSTPLRDYILSDDMDYRRPTSQRPGGTKELSVEDRSRRKLVALLLRSLQAAYQAEVSRNQPTEEQLQEFLAELDPEVRVDLLRRPRDEAHYQLLMRYYAKHGARSGRNLSGDADLRAIMQMLQPGRNPRGIGGSRADFPDRRGMQRGDDNGQRPPFGSRQRGDFNRPGQQRFGPPRGGGRRPDGQ